MQDVYTRKFQDSIQKDTGNDMIEGGFDNEEDQAAMKLVDTKCWHKITYIFGVMGPEIMFFCQENSVISSFQSPDLDPIKVSIRQFNQHGLEINTQIIDPISSQGNDSNMVNIQGLQILLSKFITLKQVTNYAVLNMVNLMPELSQIQKQTLLLINRDNCEENQIIELSLEGNSNRSSSEMQLGLGLIEGNQHL